MSTEKTRGEKIIEVMNQYTDDDISDMADDYARRYSHNEDEQQGLYAGYIAGFKEAYGMGVQDGADIFDED